MQNILRTHRVNDGASSSGNQRKSAITLLSNDFGKGKINDPFDFRYVCDSNSFQTHYHIFCNYFLVLCFSVSLEGKKVPVIATMAKKTEKFNRFAAFFLDQLSADITFSVGPENCPEPEKIPAHKIVLASCSPVFNAMFFGTLPEQNVIRIIDVSIDGFKEFLEYFYYDDMDITKHKCIVEVMYLAEKYEVSGYLAAILPFLMTTDPMVCLELVAKCEFPELQEIVKRMIVDNPMEFIKSESFLQCDSIVLKMILGWDEVKTYGEEIFMACYRWTENAWRLKQQQEAEEKPNQSETVAKVEPTPADIRALMNDFIHLIEFGSMKSHVLVTNLVKFADFFTKSDLVGIHKVLAMKYPIGMYNLAEHTFDLIANEQMYIIKKIETITFESSKELFFIDYHLSDYVNTFSVVNTFYPLIMTLSKKPLADEENDIVLMRKIVRSSFLTRSNDEDTIIIEPNTKYEIRLKILNFTTGQKLCAPSAYTSNVCNFGNDEKVTIEGCSIISKLQFKCRN